MVNVIINNKKYSMETLKLLTGEEQPDTNKLSGEILIVAEAVDNPDKLPYLIEEISDLKIENKEKFRFVLLRVQIDSELHMNEDIQRNHKILYVAQVIEKLLYGDMLLEVGTEENDEEEEEE